MFALIDCNSFFASCERVFDPKLDGKPVGILSNNDGCIIARSAELKALGVEMGTPFHELKPLIVRYGIIVRSSNYTLYGDMSRRVMSILTEFSPDIQQYSIDEAFIRLSLPAGKDYLEYGKLICGSVTQWTGIPVGVGIAPTKTLAKLANHRAKKQPDGVFLMPDDPMPVIGELPVDEVWGIGKRLCGKLQQMGIRTIRQFCAQDEGFIQKKFNVCLVRTLLELRGIPTIQEVDTDEPSQSISCSRSFGAEVTELQDLTEAVSNYTAQAAEKLRREKLCATAAEVYFQVRPEYGPVQQEGGFNGKTVTFSQPLSATTDLLRELSPLLPRIYQPGRRYKKAGIILFGLVDATNVQQDLFEPRRDAGKDKLYSTIDEINRKFGRNTVFHLSEGIARPWSMKREHLSPNYTTDWNDIPSAK